MRKLNSGLRFPGAVEFGSIPTHTAEQGSVTSRPGLGSLRRGISYGATSKFVGSLCCHFQIDGSDLSTKIRETLNMADLLLFDGGLDEEGNVK